MPGWLERAGGATSAIWRPGGLISQMAEGHGIQTVDRNGYVNPDIPLEEEGYILVLGSSHTMAIEVPMETKYVSLLNEWLSDDGELRVYNMAQHGHMFPDLVAGFEAAIQEFPDSSTVIMEINAALFSQETLEAALESRTFSQEERGGVLWENVSLTKRLETAVKELVPFAGYWKDKQLPFMIPDFSGAFGLVPDEEQAAEEEELDEAAYAQILEKIFTKMKNCYQGEIIIVYHPGVELDSDGMKLVRDSAETVFEETCRRNGIRFLDVGDAFIRKYKQTNAVPYGFWNTTMGSGHLNETGHRIMAEELYRLLMGG